MFQGEVDISKGEGSEHCDEEAQKIKMEVLVYCLFTQPALPTIFVNLLNFCFQYYFIFLKTNAASDTEEINLKTVKMGTSNDIDRSDDDKN